MKNNDALNDVIKSLTRLPKVTYACGIMLGVLAVAMFILSIYNFITGDISLGCIDLMIAVIDAVLCYDDVKKFKDIMGRIDRYNELS